MNRLKSVCPHLLTGLVLAGGESQRFGSDKSVRLVQGVRMIDRVIAVVRPLVTEVLISVRTAEEAPQGVDARFVPDLAPDQGPLGGLQAGLAVASAPWVLVVACDMPFLTGHALELLIARCGADARAVAGEESRAVAAADASFPAGAANLQAVVAETGEGRRHPLCACYRRSIGRHVEEALASPDRSMHGLLDRLLTAGVRLPDDALRNVNTPEDLFREPPIHSVAP